jgi:hypothetical protein
LICGLTHFLRYGSLKSAGTAMACRCQKFPASGAWVLAPASAQQQVHWSHVFKRQAGATALACGASCFCSISRRQTHSLVRTIPGVQAASGGKGECFKRFSSVQFSSVQFSSVQFSSVQFSSVQFSSLNPRHAKLYGADRKTSDAHLCK